MADFKTEVHTGASAEVCYALTGFGTTQQTLNCSLPMQLPSQQSFDPLAQPDLLAAFTQKAKEPGSSWMSFDDAGEASPRPFNQSFTGSAMLDRASPASGQVGSRLRINVEAWSFRPVTKPELDRTSAQHRAICFESHLSVRHPLHSQDGPR